MWDPLSIGKHKTTEATNPITNLEKLEGYLVSTSWIPYIATLIDQNRSSNKGHKFYGAESGFMTDYKTTFCLQDGKTWIFYSEATMDMNRASMRRLQTLINRNAHIESLRFLHAFL